MDKFSAFPYLRIVKPKAFSWILILLITACIDPYQLEVIPTGEDYLVVDGFINSGDGPTIFKLSHLMNLDAEGNGRPELHAQVNVESDAGETFLLPEVADGKYSLEHPVETNKQYRIRIQTADDKEYLSDFVEVKHTPPIDSVTWSANQQDRLLEVSVNTHDPDNATRYYQWEYEETWHYTSDSTTKYEFRDGEFLFNPQLDIYNCWQTKKSTRILTTSSARLTHDLIYKFPLLSITPESEKARIMYSVLVNQHALTREAFTYFEEIKKFTELNAGIFAPLPANAPGNIRCISDPDVPVVGFISAYSVESIRLFIRASEIPSWFPVPHLICPENCAGGGQADRSTDCERGNFRCILPCILLNNVRDQQTAIMDQVRSGFISLVGSNPSSPLDYMLTKCVDCRKQGGTNVKPGFWP